jgi:hypothetical protein
VQGFWPASRPDEAASALGATLQPPEAMPARTSDALRVTLTESSRRADQLLAGGIYVDLPGWRREEWAHIGVRARTSTVTTMGIGLNVGADLTRSTFARSGGRTPVVSDGDHQALAKQYKPGPKSAFTPNSSSGSGRSGTSGSRYRNGDGAKTPRAGRRWSDRRHHEVQLAAAPLSWSEGLRPPVTIGPRGRIDAQAARGY